VDRSQCGGKQAAGVGELLPAWRLPGQPQRGGWQRDDPQLHVAVQQFLFEVGELMHDRQRDARQRGGVESDDPGIWVLVGGRDDLTVGGADGRPGLRTSAWSREPLP
jgi:hypothetical protein